MDDKTGGLVDEIKVRGFTLKSPSSQEKINYATMKDLIVRWTQGEARSLETETSNMKINRQAQTVTSVTGKKVYSNTGFNKRWKPSADLAGEIVRTFPYGAVDADFCDLPK